MAAELNKLVFGFPRPLSLADVKKGQLDRPGNDDHAAWVSSHTIKLGPEIFWKTWGTVTSSSSDHDNYTIKATIEKAWDERDELAWRDELQKSIMIKHQIGRITRRTQNRLWTPEGGQTRVSVDMRRLLGSLNPFHYAWPQGALDAQDEPPPLRSHDSVPSEQALNARVIGKTKVPEWQWPNSARRRGREVCCYNCYQNGGIRGDTDMWVDAGSTMRPTVKLHHPLRSSTSFSSPATPCYPYQ